MVRSRFDRVVYVRRCWLPTVNSQSAVINWFSTLSLLMRGGIKIEEALHVMSSYKGYEFTNSLLQLVKSGQPFHEALSSFEFFFDHQSILMVKALLRYLPIEGTCDFIAGYKTKIHEKHKLMTQSLIQPCITLSLTIIVCTALLLFLSPTIEFVFLDMKIQMPLVLRIIHNLNVVRVAFLGVVLAATSCALHRNYRNLPFVRNVLTDRDIFVALYFMGHGLKNGLKIIEAIDTSIPVLSSNYVIGLMKQLKADVLQGSSVSSSLKSSKANDVYINIVRANELVGSLAQGFISASEAADHSFQSRLGIITKLASPLTTIITGLLILGFLHSFIFPMYTCISSALN